MDQGFLDLITNITDPVDILDYLNHSSYDELLQLNIPEDRFLTVYHIQDKYSMPVTDGTYRAFYDYVRKNLVHPDDRSLYSDCMHPDRIHSFVERSEIHGASSLQFRIHSLEKNWLWVEQILIGGPAYGMPENVYLCYIFDIQNQKDRETGATRIGRHEHIAADELTGLPLSKAFLYQVAGFLASADESWLLLTTDLDNFKFFNDLYGRKAGDKVLTTIGSIFLKHREETGGLAGYMGSDDFSLLFREGSLSIEDLYREIHDVVVNYGVSVGFLPSIGITRAKKGLSALRLYDQTSLAIREAKTGFENRIRYYDPGMAEETENEFLILADFQAALAQNEITFYLQPQVRSSSGRLVGAEALARWIRPDGTIIPPSLYIPILEKYGFVTDLDKSIWEQVCIWIRAWLDQGNPLIPISINVSQIDIFTIDVPRHLQDLIKRYSLPWNALKIEITESACGQDSKKVRSVMHQLREIGFLVMMDDFGSGYSSLNMLHELELDVIKIDAHFLQMDSSTESRGIHILESVVNMTKTLGLPVIIEGVETEEQKEFLAHLGCRYMQGYYFYRPLPLAKFEEIARDPARVEKETKLVFKANQQFQVREFLDSAIYSDSMLNNILGPVAFYAWHGEDVDIVRFNEQFYEMVNISEFHDRLTGIQRYMPVKDQQLLRDALKQAYEDRLNGSTAILTFIKPAGESPRFLIRFYFLQEADGIRRFYGSATDVTRITLLERYIELISHSKSECIIFYSDKPGVPKFRVPVQGLDHEIGITREQVEQEMNDGTFFDRIVPEHREMLFSEVRNVLLGIDFSTHFSMYNAEGKRVNLFMQADYVDDEASDVRILIIISVWHEDL